MKIKNLLFTTLFFSSINLLQTKSEDLFEDFQSQKDCNWENANYKTINNDAEESRFCIDNKNNIYRLTGDIGPNWTGVTISGLGPIRLGNLDKQEVTKGNNCLLGTNIQCLSTIVYTTTQYKVDGNYLKQFWREEINGSKGKVNSKILGINRKAKNELLKKAISLNQLAYDEFMANNYREAGKYAFIGSKWIKNQVSYYLVAKSQIFASNQNNYVQLYENALGFFESLIKEPSMEYGFGEKLFYDGDIYNMRAEIKSQLNIDPGSYCNDIKKAIELNPDYEVFQENFKAFNCG